MKKLFRLTQSGIDELQVELDSLIAKRTDIADAIRIAREQGDLGENAEYQTAIAEKEKNEARIVDVEHIIQNVAVITKPKGDSKIQLGSHVKLQSGAGKTKEFQVVGTVEADPLNSKISDESPIGKAVLGKKEGDSVEIVTPAETTTYKIVEIS